MQMNDSVINQDLQKIQDQIIIIKKKLIEMNIDFELNINSDIFLIHMLNLKLTEFLNNQKILNQKGKKSGSFVLDQKLTLETSF